MSTLLQGPRGNCGPIVRLSYHPAFCGPKNEKYLSAFDVPDLVELLWCSDGLKAFEFSFPWTHLSGVFILSSSAYKRSTFHRAAPPSPACCLRVVLFCDTCVQPPIMPHSQTKVDTSARLMLEQRWIEGVDSCFYLPISLWILLQYWQTDS